MGSNSRSGVVVAALLGAAVALASAARAEDLPARRLYLGQSLTLQLELKEGMFAEFLRWVRLKKAPRQIVDLTTLGRAGDSLFLGDDLKLYYSSEKEEGAAYQIGSANRLWQIKLDPDVELLKVPELSKLMEPGAGSVTAKLRVRTATPRDKAGQVAVANFEFWLHELVYEYDRFDPKKKTDENYPYVRDAIRSALPRAAGSSQELLENLKTFERYVHSSEGPDLVPYRKLIEELIREVEATDAPPALLERYRKLRDGIYRKTEES